MREYVVRCLCKWQEVDYGIYYYHFLASTTEFVSVTLLCLYEVGCQAMDQGFSEMTNRSSHGLSFSEKLGPPEILQEPSNLTVQQGTRAIFQCRVHSKDPPIFYWLRRTDHRTSNYVALPFLNDTYEASSEQCQVAKDEVTCIFMPT